ncbi:MAG: tetratricopeptide repeat protein [Ignavibacteriaceae bacterium]|nr:tetratricopeptide repeat protein [Ignavibacteriaceae bacterium]
MTKSAAETFNNKVSLIYEFNKKSPLFIRKADEEIKNNHIEKAVEILNAGLKIYPDYAAANILLGRAYSLLGQFNNALKYIKNGAALINSPKTYDYYLKEIDAARKQRSLFDSSTRTSFFSSELEPELPVIFPDEIKIDAKVNPPKENKQPANIDDRLEDVAREISFAKLNDASSNIDYELSNLENLSGHKMFVSETLAKIYIAQGEFHEAIDVYHKLIKKSPAKEDYYLQKISELQSQLE